LFEAHVHSIEAFAYGRRAMSRPLAMLALLLGACAHASAPAPAPAPAPVPAPAPAPADPRLAGIALPGATNAERTPLADGPVVAVAHSEVRVDGVVVADTRAIEESQRLMRIDGLFNTLKGRREAWKQAHAGEPFPGVAWLAIDASTPAVVVKSVFQTAAFAGFPNLRFVVRARDGSIASLPADAQIPGPPRAMPPPHVPGLRAEATTVNGRLPPEVIQRIVRSSFGAIRRCYDAGLARDAGLKGLVRVRFVIGRDGRVSEARDESSTLADAEVVACIVNTFAALSFPQPEGGVVTVVYPIAFRPGD
jgi:outer membrane biosynthesis protein TonB